MKPAIQLVKQTWLKSAYFEPAVFATLTLRNAIHTAEGWVRGTPEIYSATLRHFLNVLNRRVFKNLVKRGKRLRVMAKPETDESGRRHYHLVIEIPRSARFSDFRRMIITEWSKTDWGYHQTDVQQVYSDGVYAYIAKYNRGIDCSDLDWQNTNLH